MKTTPFDSVLDITGKILATTSNIKISFRKLPKHMGAGYRYPENGNPPEIVLPKINPHELSKKEKIILNALLGHEVLHHLDSSCEAWSKALKESRFIIDLYNCLEDARNEHNKSSKIQIGVSQDLDYYRASKIAEYTELLPKLFEQNPWGCLFQRLKYELPGYGLLPMPEDMKKYYDIAMEILNKDNFFQEVSKQGKKGSERLYEATLEIVKKWQKETEPEDNSNPDIHKEYEDDQNSNPIEIDSLNQDVARIKIKEKPYLAYNPLDREIVPEYAYDEFLEIYSSISSKIHNIKRKLTRALVTEADTYLERGLRRGKLDSRSYYKLASGGRNIKKQISQGKEIDTAVTLLIDLSGSMQYTPDNKTRAQIAVEVATLIAEVLAPLDIPLEVLGYNTSIMNNTDMSHASKEGYTRKEIVNYWIFKSFNEKWNRIKYRMGTCKKELNTNDRTGSCGGCNVDHENLIHAAKRLYQRSEKNKVLIVLCDGQPSGYGGTYNGLLERELKITVENINKSAMKLFCFGIQSPDVAKYYSPDFQLIENLEDLETESLNQLSKYLLGRKI